MHKAIFMDVLLFLLWKQDKFIKYIYIPIEPVFR